MKYTQHFDFQIPKIVDIINSHDATFIGLQFPEGFKRKSILIAQQLEAATNTHVCISGNPCFGACDIDMELVKNVDLFFHFGHAPLDDITNIENVHFIEVRSNVQIQEIIKKAIPLLKGKKIGVLTTVQHVHTLSDVHKILQIYNKECIIGQGDNKIAYPGQILGCNFSAARYQICDEYLYIGSGYFHPIGVALSTNKRVLIADPFINEIKEVDVTKIIKQRSAVIGNCFNAQEFGIIVSTKLGQKRSSLALNLKKLIIKKGKKAQIIVMDLITPAQLLQFKVDAFVNTACPRLTIDEVGRFSAPMLTPQELKIVLGEEKWENLVFDEITSECVTV